MKICRKCSLEKEENYFSKNQLSCKECNKKYYDENKNNISEKNKKYYEENKKEFIEYQKQYYLDNKNKIAEYKIQYRIDNKNNISSVAKQYYKENKNNIIQKSKDRYKKDPTIKLEYQKQYYLEHAAEIAEYKIQYRINNKHIINAYNNAKKKNDPIYKMRWIASNSILKALKRKSSSKNGNSITKYLPYTILELKEYIEKQFLESSNEWMSWQNHGKYNAKTWKNDDKTTWTWQLDHIIPHSMFSYTSMDELSFRNCWALNNLRPYSAKQNIIDGITGIRHVK